HFPSSDTAPPQLYTLSLHDALPISPGSTIDIKEVLMVGGDKPVLGSPYVNGAKVTVVVEQQFRGPKILVFKKKRRHKYRNMRGRSEEHTSELQSPYDLVCRLLLEKK